MLNLSKQSLEWLKEEYTHITPEDLEQVNMALEIIRLNETLGINAKTILVRDKNGVLQYK